MSSNNTFNSFSTTSSKSSSSSSQNKSFLESNSLVANFTFLLLVVFGFVILFRIGIAILYYFLKPNPSPHLIDGMVEGSQMLIFPQDPSSNGAVTIYRSINAQDGIEFTWSIWIYIVQISNSSNPAVYKHIFSKGNSTISENGLIFPNNAPGLYIKPNVNDLVVIMNTFNVINEEVVINDVPLNKWVNVIIRCQNTTLDVFINGIITRSVNLVGLPKQNYGDVYVAMNGGFDGNISNLWYYNYALGTAAIQQIAGAGPNTKSASSQNLTPKQNLYNYLSLRWFFAGSSDSYNPTTMNNGWT